MPGNEIDYTAIDRQAEEERRLRGSGLKWEPEPKEETKEDKERAIADLLKVQADLEKLKEMKVDLTISVPPTDPPVMKLLCRTCTYELDVLLAILRNNGIQTEHQVYVPTSPIQGSDMVIWNIFTTREKLEEAGKVLSKEGIAIWVHR